MSEERKYQRWRMLPVFEKWREATILNSQLLQIRRQTRKKDQGFRARRRKEQPDLKKTIKKYPFREPLSPLLRQLYKQTVKDIGRILGVRYNRWVMVPPCAFAYDLDAPAIYLIDRHEIVIARAFDYWFTQIDIVLPRLNQAIRWALQGKHQTIQWVELGQRVMRDSLYYQEKLEKLEVGELFPRLSEVWSQFLQQLPPLLEETAHLELPSDALFSWYELLVAFRRDLRSCLRSMFVHELIHAHTRWFFHRSGEALYRQVGLLSRKAEADPDVQEEDSLEHRMVNEALTEWIAIRFRQELYQTTGDFHWNGISYASPYPAWIIEAVVQKLEREWLRLADELPGLIQYRIFNPTDLLYTFYFSDATRVSFFKEALAIVTGDKEAFEKLSIACRQFYHFYHDHQPLDEEEFKVSMLDMCQMFDPFFEREMFAAFSPSTPDEQSPEEV
jgi:hypothetical protein